MGGELRRRKKDKSNDTTPSQSGSGKGSPPTPSTPLDFLKGISSIAGLFICVYVGYRFGTYVLTLHENHLWFTNIKEVEREISLRTECGLYYSYYKQLIHAPTLKQGITDLTRDNSTEHGHTINILERFNVYQEVLLAVLHRTLNIQLQPMLFYAYSCFYLTGLGVSVLFLISWYLSGTWLAGLLSAIYFTVNLDDATRVFFTVNLREIFAFPFLWAQILCICVYLERRNNLLSSTRVVETLCRLGILVFGFLFAITWQFNQFVFLIQALSIYAVGVIQVAPLVKVRNVLLLQMFSLLGVWVLQFGHPMILGSLVFSFVPAAIFTLYLCKNFRQTGGIVFGAFKILIQLVLTLILTGVINFVVKNALQLDADAHIFKFILGKFGLSNPRDFESKVYLCHGAFVFLDNGFFTRTTKSFLFPPYMVVFCGILFVIGRDLLLEWCDASLTKTKFKPADANDPTDKQFFFNRRPNLAYMAIQSCVSGVIALMTLRMKYLWTPHLVILSSVGLCDGDIVEGLLGSCGRSVGRWVKEGVRVLLPLALSAFLLWTFLPTYHKQMDDLKEFWDPDTVELMEWINNNTKPEDSFGGSMQLLAGVKCSTGRHLTNHPHFEDKWLRERTKQVYQIYGRLPPREVYDVLREIGTNYIILEDSICLAPSDGCRTPDLMDLENGHVPDNGKVLPGLEPTDTPRFCDEIRHDTTAYSRLFKSVLKNKTFRVYKLVVPPEKGG